MADLSEADLSNANFRGADLSDAYLEGADLSGADLSGAVLLDSNLRVVLLSDADFSRANLSGAIFSGSVLSGANFSGANFFQADLRGAELKELRNWRKVGSLSLANVWGVRNAPEGFLEWEIGEKGAVSVETVDEWWGMLDEPELYDAWKKKWDEEHGDRE